MEKTDTTLLIRLTKELKGRITKKATKQGMGVSSYIRYTLIKDLDEK